MVETITPVVDGGRGRRWVGLLALHATGATLAAAAFGAAIAGLGALLDAPWDVGLVLVAAVAALYLAEVAGAPIVVPQLRRQVPNWWRSFFPFGVASFLYGVGLGVGFFTYLRRGTLVVVTVAAFVSGHPLIGALVLAPFGLARGLSAVVAFGARTPEEGAALVRRLERSASWPGWRVAHGVALGAVLIASLVVFGRRGGWTDVGVVAAAALALVFAVAGIAKIARWQTWRRTLSSYALPAWIEGPGRVGVPLVELGIVVLAVLGFASTAGLVALVALAAFSSAIVAARLRVGPKLGCGCFAGDRFRDHRYLLARNAMLIAVAAVAWVQGIDVAPLESAELPRGNDVVAAVITVTGMALAVWVAVRAFVVVRRSGAR
jgi:hypothetical protein